MERRQVLPTGLAAFGACVSEQRPDLFLLMLRPLMIRRVRCGQKGVARFQAHGLYAGFASVSVLPGAKAAKARSPPLAGSVGGGGGSAQPAATSAL